MAAWGPEMAFPGACPGSWWRWEAACGLARLHNFGQPLLPLTVSLSCEPSNSPHS